MQRASRLVAHGLMPPPGRLDAPTLVFHIVVAELATLEPDGAPLRTQLLDTLAQMSPLTRRPIRFLGQPSSLPGGLEDEPPPV